MPNPWLELIYRSVYERKFFLVLLGSCSSTLLETKRQELSQKSIDLRLFVRGAHFVLWIHQLLCKLTLALEANYLGALHVVVGPNDEHQISYTSWHRLGNRNRSGVAGTFRYSEPNGFADSAYEYRNFMKFSRLEILHESAQAHVVRIAFCKMRQEVKPVTSRKQGAFCELLNEQQDCIRFSSANG